MKIELKILEHAKEYYQKSSQNEGRTTSCNLPEYATEGSAAMDLRSVEDAVIYPGETKLIKTGLAIHIKDPNVLGIINPRSGLGNRIGLVLGNGQGWIDSDYTGELLISAWSRKNAMPYFDDTIKIKAGDRIVQMAFIPVIKAQWTVVEEFSNSTDRGTGGYGSTGVK